MILSLWNRRASTPPFYILMQVAILCKGKAGCQTNILAPVVHTFIYFITILAEIVRMNITISCMSALPANPSGYILRMNHTWPMSHTICNFARTADKWLGTGVHNYRHELWWACVRLMLHIDMHHHTQPTVLASKALFTTWNQPISLETGLSTFHTDCHSSRYIQWLHCRGMCSHHCQGKLPAAGKWLRYTVWISSLMYSWFHIVQQGRWQTAAWS